ncbi:MAG: translocation protein TolB [Bacteroidetes bacterium]|nr:translocation protein TolB [Bacteroidota bacterium]
MLGFRKYIFLFVFFHLTFLASYAQVTKEQFGKNRLQYKDFNWKFYSTENFDIYFYEGGVNNASLAVKYLEEEFEGITEILGYAPYNKTKIFLYNSVTDLQQSNVGVNQNNFTVGGQTNFVKSQVELAYPGTYSAFKSELIFKVTMILINDMMFGGSLSDMFQSSYLLNLPLWFLHGAAHYIAYGWSTEMDDYMRDLMNKRKIKKLTKFEGKDATLVGHSIWNYIAEVYGRSNISNILNLTRIIRNEENSIANTLGLPFKQFLFNWQSYYNNMAEKIREDYKTPHDSLKLQKRNNKKLVFKSVKISPDGRYLAYTENQKGKYKIKLRDLQTGKENTILTSGYKVINQKIEYDLPLLAWRDNSSLAIISNKIGKVFMWMYDLPSKSKQRKDLGRFNHVKDFSFSENGRLVVLSADLNGQNDIFLLSMRRNAIKRVTSDPFDDLHPRFVPNSDAIVFSSNRPSDTLNIKKSELKDIGKNFNLFMYDLDTTENVLVGITKTVSQDIMPIPVGSNIYYLSDQKGIFNIYKYNLTGKVFHQVTNFRTGVKEYDINYEAGMAAFTMLKKGKDYVFVQKDFNFDNNIFTPQTSRQSTLQAKFISNRLVKRRLKESKIADSIAFAVAITDTTSLISLDDIVTESTEEETGIIDTDNYTFDSELEDAEEDNLIPTFLENYRRNQKTKEIIGPLPYKTRFTANNIVTSWVIDPLLGFGIQLETEMNDILENHKFFGGILATSDLKSGDVFAEYQFLKYMIDYHVRFDRNVVFVEQIEALQKYSLNKFEVGAALPLTVTSRFGLSPFMTFTRFHELDPLVIRSTPVPPPGGIINPITQSKITYGGIKAEFVYDNTLINGLNLFEGSRGKIQIVHYEALNDSERSFTNISLDLRHYQKIHRELVLAGRLFYGRFFGNTNPSYLLGGMDNWLFNDTEIAPGSSDPLFFETYRDKSNVLFNEYVTNLRGFDYNKFNGENVLLANVELRFPIVRYFHRGPISSNFFRNLQLIGFYDIGSAWTGSAPFANENNLNTTVLKDENSPFQAKIKNFNNPWLSSYGTGVRTVLLGYFLKFDVAWPLEDFETKNPEFYVTLGYDF